MTTRTLASAVLASALCVGVLAACGPGGSSITGHWTCRSPANTTGDSVDISMDGTITVTKPDGQSASGTWTLNGSTMTVHGLGPTGTEDFAYADNQITGQGEQVCTRS